FKGKQKVEFVGSLQMRMMDAQGQPIGGVIDIAQSDTATNLFYLGPTITWGGETQQYFLAWTQTDTRWNPVTLGVSWYPFGGTFRDSPTRLFGTVATAYPVGAAASYAGVINPLDVIAADHHIMYTGQEDDFGANYLRRYKFLAPPSDPGPDPGPSSKPSGGGGGGSGSHCGMSQAAAGTGWGSILALAGALLLAFCPRLGRSLRPGTRR